MNAQGQDGVRQAIAGLRRRLRGLYLLHGTGLALAYLALVALCSYLLDRTFHLPQFLRIGILASTSAGFLLILYRKVIFPQTLKIQDRDIALAIDGRFPELREKIVSSIELMSPDPGSSAEMVEELQRGARESLRDLPLANTLDSRRVVRKFGLGCFGMALCAVVFLADTDSGRIWVRRFLGEEARWPQQTFLDIQIVSSEGNIKIQRENDSIRVEMVRGGELPIRVIANGWAPEAVLLHLNGGKLRNMVRSGSKEFTHVFSAVREPFEFWATGGDDQDENPKVEVIPLPPPELAKISVELNFPAYTGLTPITREGGSVEALMGSQAEVRIQIVSDETSPEEKTVGSLHFQQSGTRFPLVADPQNPNILKQNFSVQNSDRYSIELTNSHGLRNPESGSFPVIALPDRKPEIRLLAPARVDLDGTVKSRLPVRATIRDDYGITSALLQVKIGKDGPTQEIPLTQMNRSVENSAQAGVPARKGLFETALEIQSLRVGDRPLHEGEVLFLRLKSLDNRDPEPNSSESAEIRIILVSPEEIERRIQDTLARIKESIETLHSLQKEKADRVGDFLAVIESEGKLPPGELPGLRGILVGQNRVNASARASAGQFLELFESALFNRLERESDVWISAYDTARKSIYASKDISVEEREGEEITGSSLLHLLDALKLAHQAGSLGISELLSKLLEMSRLGYQVSELHSKDAADALDQALLSSAGEDQKRLLNLALEKQKLTLSTLEQLLDRLSDWDNYQTVINFARELVERQKAINNRTKDLTRQR